MGRTLNRSTLWTADVPKLASYNWEIVSYIQNCIINWSISVASAILAALSTYITDWSDGDCGGNKYVGRENEIFQLTNRYLHLSFCKLIFHNYTHTIRHIFIHCHSMILLYSIKHYITLYRTRYRN